MNIDLSKRELYVKDLAKVAFVHKKKPSMQTKRDLDREASFFKKHAIALVPKLERLALEQRDMLFVAGNEDRVNHVVMIFNEKLFTKMEDLDKMCEKRLKKLKPFLKSDVKEEINFQLLGATANLDYSKGKTQNQVVACARFVSSVKVNNFCMVAT